MEGVSNYYDYLVKLYLIDRKDRFHLLIKTANKSYRFNYNQLRKLDGQN